MGFPSGSDVNESACSEGEPGREDPLGKEMATHSSILVWRIPWTEEPSGLQSMGLQRAWHDLVKNTFTFFFFHLQISRLKITLPKDVEYAVPSSFRVQD